LTKFDKDKRNVLYAINTILHYSSYLCYLPEEEKIKRIKHLKKIKKRIEKEKYDGIMRKEWLDEYQRWIK
jgi:hypothetical protein